MEPILALLLYGFSFVAGLVVLTLVAQIELFQSVFFRVLAGGSAGSLSAWYLVGVAPFISFTEYALNGKLGVGGYVFVLSLAVLLGVWTWNLMNHDGVIVR